MPIIRRIPYITDSAQAQPVKRCIKRAAQENGASEFLVAQIMADFFTQLAEEVATGKIVHVPGLGKFGAIAKKTKKERTNGLTHFISPRFYPSRGFNNEVEATCSVARAQAVHEKLKAHGRHHHPSSRPDRAHTRVFSAMHGFKQQLRAQEREIT